MADKKDAPPSQSSSPEKREQEADERSYYYRIRFRQEGQEYTAKSNLPDLARGEVVMVRTDRNPEPARVIVRAPDNADDELERGVSYDIMRRATPEEQEKYARLPILEQEAIDICQERIRYLRLPMHMVRVERFFNGSKIIFYFTAESRVDFRELVKNLVQEFRTRVEMRQIGVRHETQMTGGIGACGRELCCTSFLRKFESVSIKMAKTQDLPLNPSKISGVCNRLLCCLTYEYDAYKSIKQEMPRPGRLIRYEGEVYRVQRVHPLQSTVQAVSREVGEVLLTEEQWRRAEPVQKSQPRKQAKGKKGGRDRSSRSSRKKSDKG
jgi:cell fate regulator YaaT (PSP1 superfamily)